MSDPIILKLTAAGLDAVLDAETGGFKCQISHCKLSSARFDSVEEDSRTELPDVIHECLIAAGGVSVQARTLRFAVNFDVESEIEVGSMGVYTSTGVLFAIASVTSGNLFKVYPRITLLGAFGITLGAKLIEYVQVLTDPNGAIAQKLLMDHETAEDPHPQYANQIEFSQAQDQLRAIVQGVYHVGSWHGTDNTAYNPRTALERLFGYLTNWELRPYAPYGVLDESQPVLELYDISGTEERKASTTRIWKRLPDDFKATIIANKTWMVEANEEEVIFTIIADNIPDDTSVAYVLGGDINERDVYQPLEGFIVFQDNQAQFKVKLKGFNSNFNGDYTKSDESGEFPEKFNFTLKGAEANVVEVTIIAQAIGISQQRAAAGDEITGAFFYAGIPIGEEIKWSMGTKSGVHTVTSEYGRIIESDIVNQGGIGFAVELSNGFILRQSCYIAGASQTLVQVNNPVLPLYSDEKAQIRAFDREFVPSPQAEQNIAGGISATWGSWDSDSILDNMALNFSSFDETGSGSGRTFTMVVEPRSRSSNDDYAAPSGAWLIKHVYQVNYQDYPNLALGYKTVLASVFCYKP